MRILVAPAHFNLGEGSGSESATALKIIKVLATFADLTVITGVLTGRLDLPSNVELIRLYEGNKFNPTPWNRYRFLFDCAKKAHSLTPSRCPVDAVYHIFPFDRYHPSFLPLTKPGLNVPLIIGPVTVPHNLWKFPDEALGFQHAGHESKHSYVLLAKGVLTVGGARLVRPMTANLMQKSLSKARTIIAESQAAKDFYSRWVEQSKIKVVYNYLEFLKARPGVHQASPYKEIAIVGNLIKRKGVDRVIKIMPIVLQRYPETILRVIGSGPELTSLRNLAQRLGVSKKVIFTGRVPLEKLSQNLSKLSVLVSASWQEAFPNTIIEGMAMGIPCVSYKTAAIAEVIDDERDGFIVEQQNEYSFIDKILTLLESSSLREQFARAGRKKVEKKFSKERAAGEFREIFQVSS